MTLRLAPSPWRTDTFRRLNNRLENVVGAKTAKPFETLKIWTVGDLMRHLPRRYFSGTELSDLSHAAATARRSRCWPRWSTPRCSTSNDRSARKPRLEATITDRRGYLTLTFFGQSRLISYWQSALQPGARGIFAGKVREFNRKLQLAHPDFVTLDDQGRVVAGAQRNAGLARAAESPLIGLYPLTGKLRTWTVAECAALALDTLTGLEDPLPAWLRDAAGVVDQETAFRFVHQPQDFEQVERGRERLRFDEAFGLQLTMAYRRADAASHRAEPRPRRTGGLLDAFDARLPFTLTAGQVEVSEQIFAELARTFPMQRLLQGEVGSGKTLVALRAMLAVVDAGGQAALLAPTEVLAAQHFSTVTRLLGDLAEGGTLAAVENATGVVLVTGSQSTAPSAGEATQRAASGEAGIVIGTHALLSAGVQFADLGLVVVDEQHRFGVEQRAALSAKATTRPHVLVMTATPIPRSVAMTVFGDLETATLRELPGRPGRRGHRGGRRRAPARPGCSGPGSGSWRRSGRAGRRTSCAPGSPGAMTDRTDTADQPPATAVEDLYAELRDGPLASVRVAMLHGQLPAEEKDAVMARFVAGEIDVLVATTVIEVGVDVPNASVMVVSDADRFGISQLHQLRGRIGRGGHPGVCLLLTTAEEGSLARQRLDAVAGTRDGFALAEVDLAQRREGDVLGASQSGSRSSLKLLRVLDDADLLTSARELAERCIADDPELSNPALADIVTEMETDAAGEWLERT